VLHSGGLQHHKGVALIIRSSFDKALVTWQPISSRILSARLIKAYRPTKHIIGHIGSPSRPSHSRGPVPTEEALDEDKDTFYSHLSSAVSDVSRHDELLLLGDFNVRAPLALRMSSAHSDPEPQTTMQSGSYRSAATMAWSCPAHGSSSSTSTDCPGTQATEARRRRSITSSHAMFQLPTVPHLQRRRVRFSLLFTPLYSA